MKTRLFIIALIAKVFSFTNPAQANANSCNKIFTAPPAAGRGASSHEIKELEQYLSLNQETTGQNRNDVKAKTYRVLVKFLPSNQVERIAFLSKLPGFNLRVLARFNYGASQAAFAATLGRQLEARGDLRISDGVRGVIAPLIEYANSGKINLSALEKESLIKMKIGYLEDAILTLNNSDGKNVPHPDVVKILQAISSSFIFIPASEQVKLLEEVYGSQDVVNSIRNLNETPVENSVISLIRYFQDRQEIGLLNRLLNVLLQRENGIRSSPMSKNVASPLLSVAINKYSEEIAILRSQSEINLARLRKGGTDWQSIDPLLITQLESSLKTYDSATFQFTQKHQSTNSMKTALRNSKEFGSLSDTQVDQLVSILTQTNRPGGTYALNLEHILNEVRVQWGLEKSFDLSTTLSVLNDSTPYLIQTEGKVEKLKELAENSLFAGLTERRQLLALRDKLLGEVQSGKGEIGNKLSELELIKQALALF